MIKKIANRALRFFGSEVTPLSKNLDTVDFRNYLRNFGDLTGMERKFLIHIVDNFHHSESQIFQDLLVDFLYEGQAGIFCEAGAADGIINSNTYFLEKYRGWKGVVAEPAKVWHEKLEKNRNSAIIDQRCLHSKSEEAVLFREAVHAEHSGIEALLGNDMHKASRKRGKTYQVETVSLDNLLEQNLDGHGLDYLSLDTEGSEFEILDAFDFELYRPKVITVEHNYSALRDKIHSLLLSKNYVRIFERFSLYDDWYEDRTLNEMRNLV